MTTATVTTATPPSVPKVRIGPAKPPTVTPFHETMLKILRSKPNIAEVLILLKIAKQTRIPQQQDDITMAIDEYFAFDSGNQFEETLREMFQHLISETVRARQEKTTKNEPVVFKHQDYEFRVGDYFDSELGVGLVLDTTKPKFLVIDGKGRGDYCAKNLESLPTDVHPLSAEDFGQLKAELQTILGIVRLSLNGANHCVVA